MRACPPVCGMTSERRPNVLVVTAHDMGRYLGCYGRQAQTPNLDAFADEGALLEEFFCTSPTCTPSRASVQTGLLPHNNGVMGHPIRDQHGDSPRRQAYKGWEIHEGIRTLPMYLNEAGYQTHLAAYQHASGLPERVGYQRIHDNRRDENPHVDGARNGARNVADCVDRVLHALDDRPFFLAASTGNTHRPFSNRDGGFKDDPVPGYDGPAPEDVELPDHVEDTDEHRQAFADMFEDAYELDAAFGRILASLDEAGYADDTLVCFVTDHGIHFPKAKGTCYDPGLETALLMRLPGRIEAGRRYDDLVSNVDLLPTILDLLDLDVPYGLDGQSIEPLLAGDGEGRYEPREAVFGETTWFGEYIPARAVRTERYKFIKNFWPRRIPAAEGHTRETEVELYDLATDPHETENLVDDPAYHDVRERLQARLARKLHADGDPILEGPIPPKRGVFDVTLREPGSIDGRPSDPGSADR